MWYRVEDVNGNWYIDEARKADRNAEGISYTVHATFKTIEELIQDTDEDLTDGEVLDIVQKLIDDGESYAV